MAVYYLKDEDAGTTYELDQEVSDLETGLPTRNYKQTQLISNGSVISGPGTFPGRELAFSKKFHSTDEAGRDAFLQFLNKADYRNISLYKNITGFLGKMTVKSMAKGGESYKNIVLSGSVKFKVMSYSPFWEKTTTTTAINSTITDTTESTEPITIAGFNCKPIFTFTATADFSLLIIKYTNSRGIVLQNSFLNGDVIVVTMGNSEIGVTINGNDAGRIWSSNSTPFLLEGGDSNLYVTATSGTFKVEYNERRL